MKEENKKQKLKSHQRNEEHQKSLYMYKYERLCFSRFLKLFQKKKKILGYIKHVQVQRTKGRNNGDVYKTHELVSIKYTLGFEDLIQK